MRQILNWLARTFPAHQGMSTYSQQRMLWAVSLTGEKILGDKPCLTQALATQFLLKRRGITSSLRIGVLKDEQGQLLAHAWIEKNGLVLIGGPDSPTRYKPLPTLD